MDASHFLDRCRRDPNYAGQIVADVPMPERDARYHELSRPLPEALSEALQTDGVERLYVHQCAAIEAAWRGENVVVATGTASGKTLCYNLPVLERWLADREARTLYLFPTKALAQDQLRSLLRFRERHPAFEFEAGTYDGDTPADQRIWLRDRGHLILTNPDMLHCGILPNHSRWAAFLAGLHYVVLDEIHVYRGVFGSNVANVLVRLRRIAAHYGTQLQFIGCSATIANPGEHAANLIGAPVTTVEEDGSPRGPRRFVMWNPPILPRPRSEDLGVQRRSPLVEASALLAELVRGGVRTICFAQSRLVTELLFRHTRDLLSGLHPELAGKVRAYRGGYLAEQRREIERLLFKGELLGVISTNALELGIDIGGLDACLLVRYPGNIASTWQRAGRAGRGTEEALILFLAGDSPVDQYLAAHPEHILERSPEHATIERENPHILLGHVRCAVAELPVECPEVAGLGEPAAAILDLLAEEGQVRRHRAGWYWTGGSYPAADFSLRVGVAEQCAIVDVGTRAVIGGVDMTSAPLLVHEGAIYLQDAETYLVERLDLDQRVAYVKPAIVDYYTNPIARVSVEILLVGASRAHNDVVLACGQVRVSQVVDRYKKIDIVDGRQRGGGLVNLPAVSYETEAMWLHPDARSPWEWWTRAGSNGLAHAMETILPLHLMCDPREVSVLSDRDIVPAPNIVALDRYPGGLGFAMRAFELIDALLLAVRSLVRSCPCERGCPGCVGHTIHDLVPANHSDEERFSAGERMPDKEATLALLDHVVGS